MTSGKYDRGASEAGFPWWILIVVPWLAVMAGLVAWLWRRRRLMSPVEPVNIVLSFKRHPAGEQPAEVLIAQQTTTAPAVEPKPLAKAATPAAAELEPADDLTAIGGIGPKIAAVLRTAGITSYQRLAQADPALLRELLQSASLRAGLADPESWLAQARLAAEGRWDEVKTYLAERRAARKS